MFMPNVSASGRLTHPAEAASRASFWAKVNLLADCWEWIGARSPFGYGHIRYSGRDYSTHRCVYEYVFGQLPVDKFACHRCDNPPCVNPVHLYAGTPKNNTADMYRRGRAGLLGAEGSANRHAVLTESQVVDLRERFASGETPKDLALMFGVTSGAVNAIIRGKTWRNAGGPISTLDRRGLHRKKAS